MHPCGIREAALFRLSYQSEWRPEIRQWCDFKVAEEELEPDPVGGNSAAYRGNRILRSEP